MRKQFLSASPGRFFGDFLAEPRKLPAGGTGTIDTLTRQITSYQHPYKTQHKRPPHGCEAVFLYFLSSSGTKSRVMESIAGRSWIYLTPAASIIRLDANVLGVVAYLSDR